jgi:nucleoside-diphosphate-sugar epimerase
VTPHWQPTIAQESPWAHGPIVLTGATSQIGWFLRPRLQSVARVIAVSRSDRSGGLDAPGWHWLRADLRGEVDWSPARGAGALLHLAELPLLPRHLGALTSIGVRRIIAFSSTSRVTKERSAHPAERQLAARLAAAEAAIAQSGDALGLAWTLFRPSLIYGAGIDRNISFIARRLQRWPWFPLAGAGSGLRQPVHADDLAAACVAALDNPRTHSRIYSLSGGETLSYRAMVERIGEGIGIRPRFVRLPVSLLRLALGIAQHLPGMDHLNPQMAARMNRDLVFDHRAATADFGYRPHPFAFDPSRLSGSPER